MMKHLCLPLNRDQDPAGDHSLAYILNLLQAQIHPSRLLSPQPPWDSFFTTPTHFMASGHFVHGDLPIRCLRLLPQTSKFAEPGEATSEACERFFTTAC